MMKVLVVGSGGREHALAWKLASEPGVTEVLAAPGSHGIAQVARCLAVSADDLDGLAEAAATERADLTLVGPEAPLAAGIVDRFRACGRKIFGPDRRGARLESSKAFTKRLLVKAGVPTAAFGEFAAVAPAKAFARELGAPLVVKADGLAAGKGVVICGSLEEADHAINSMLEQRAFGAAGTRVVIEEFLQGEEVSFMALTDGRACLALASSQDHKALFDGDRGPNTGGMGAYSPAPVLTQELQREVLSSVIEPTVAALNDEGVDYKGVLYAGLMIVDGRPKVLEYNVRFGDPECQALMVRLRCPLAELLDACVEGRLSKSRVDWHSGSSVCIVMASQGYPGSYRKGDIITGVEDAEAIEGVYVFHAGTERDPQGRWRSAGGRVLGVTAIGPDIDAAVERGYAAVSRIAWEGVHFRKDIAGRALHAASRSEEA